ncbi:MAG: CAAX prenyl protease-related protein [Gemmataceae bacterium]|nr:CAAX prenyl protease-related protein [Gemmataceae bacterium]
MLAPATGAGWRNPILAYCLPFALFILLGLVESWEPLRPYYPWIYSLKIGIVAGAWWWLRTSYPGPSGARLALGALVGIVGVVLWIGLSRLNLESALPGWLQLGKRVGYNPFETIASPVGQGAFIVIRLIGLALVVPLVEEVFWRGFLLRYLIRENFATVPIGTYTPGSFAVVTLLFAAAHPELLAALVWGAAINGLLYHTKNLWACVVAHAVTNLLLGLYVLTLGAWELW